MRWNLVVLRDGMVSKTNYTENEKFLQERKIRENSYSEKLHGLLGKKRWRRRSHDRNLRKSRKTLLVVKLPRARQDISEDWAREVEAKSAVLQSAALSSNSIDVRADVVTEWLAVSAKLAKPPATSWSSSSDSWDEKYSLRMHPRRKLSSSCWARPTLLQTVVERTTLLTRVKKICRVLLW